LRKLGVPEDVVKLIASFHQGMQVKIHFDDLWVVGGACLAIWF